MLLIYTIVFLGFFAGALVSPVLSPMFLHPTEHGVLPDGTSVATRAMLLGVAMGMMRFGEFIGSPILGQLSEGRGPDSPVQPAPALLRRALRGNQVQAATTGMVVAAGRQSTLR